jgi:oligopeptide transport system substrate-binding protein
MLLERNPRYHGRFSRNVAHVRLALNVSVEDHLDLYEADELDVVYNWPFSGSEMDRLRARHADEYVYRPRFQTFYIYFNVTRPPFDDARVRRAFAMAIDKQRLAEVVDRGYHLPASGGFVPPGMPGHSSGIGLLCDAEQAWQLLADAGYPNGLNFPEVTVLARATWGTLTDYLRAQWRENLRVETGLEILDPTQPSIRSNERAWIARGGWWADYADPDNFLRVDVQLDAPHWRNPDYERRLDQARQITDQARRMALYQQADRILIEEAVVVPLVYMQSHLLLKPWVRRFPTAAIKSPGFWKDVIIEPH